MHMTHEELKEVMDDVKMKKGHRRKLPLALNRTREQGAKKDEMTSQLPSGKMYHW